MKSRSRLAQGLLHDNVVPVDYAWIWKLIVPPPKVNFFICKACNDGLPSKQRLERSHIFLPHECPYCNYHSETTNHLCYSCPFMIDTFAKLHVDYDWPIAPSLSHLENRPFSQIISHCFSDL